MSTLTKDVLAVLAVHMARLVELTEHTHKVLVDEGKASRAGIRLRGADARTLNPAQSTVVSTVPCRWLGFMIWDAGGTGSLIRFHDGNSADGAVIGTISLAPNESVRDFLGPQGIGTVYGLYAELVSGKVDGAAYVEALT